MIPLYIGSLRKIWRHGGYTTVNIAQISYGEILKGKRILITGGSSGIGLSIAKKCLSEGATVVITGRNEDKLTKAKEAINHPRLKIQTWDVSLISQIETNLAKAVEIFGGPIDILVNNAGVVIGQQFLDVEEDDWNKIYNTNSKGLFFLTQSLCRLWLERGENKPKKVINISSQGGFVGATYPYRMSKWDIAGLTQGLGIKLAPHGIIVNGIAPGNINVVNESNPEHWQSWLSNRNGNVYMSPDVAPVERFALPQEIAELAVFMMSDAANFIVGQTIVCDGGYSIK